MKLSSNSSRSISRTLQANVNGEEIGVAVLSGAVTPGQSLTLSVVIVDAKLAEQCAADVAEAVQAFWVELQGSARESGLPV